MPSYAHLFAPDRMGARRGDALVAYLGSLGAEALASRYTQAQAWSPVGPPIAAELAARRFEQRWRELPRRATPGGTSSPVRTRRTVARIIRFGLPGSSMAGQEELSDAEVPGLAAHVLALHAGRADLALP
jgi:hypothetical protein